LELGKGLRSVAHRHIFYSFSLEIVHFCDNNNSDDGDVSYKRITLKTVGAKHPFGENSYPFSFCSYVTCLGHTYVRRPYRHHGWRNSGIYLFSASHL